MTADTEPAKQHLWSMAVVRLKNISGRTLASFKANTGELKETKKAAKKREKVGVREQEKGEMNKRCP